MARKLTQFLIFTLFFTLSASARSSLSREDVLKKVLENAKLNEKLANDIGFVQATTTRKMNDGKITSEEQKDYLLTWIQDQPYLELIRKNGKELNQEDKKEEAERKKKFLKSLGKKEKEKEKEEDEDISWEDLYSKYDFEMLPPDKIGSYVFTFRPKSGKLPDRSRTERVLNHVTGKVWADSNFQIVRAEARLMDNVKFGMGILGKLEKLQIQYEQQTFNEIQVPSSFLIYFKARIALLKTEERQIQATYNNYYHRTDASYEQN